MTISVVGQYPKYRAYDPQTKLPLSGGKLYCYATGTTTPKTIYTDYARTIPAANPVILDAQGEALFYLDGIYDLVQKDSLDVTVWTVPKYNDQPVSYVASTTAPITEGRPINASFEFAGTDATLPSNWTIFKWNTVALDSAVSASGSNSLKFVSPGGAPGVSGGGTATSDRFTAVAGATYNAAAVLRSSVSGVHNQVFVLEYDSTDVLVVTNTLVDTAVNPATFTEYWGTFTMSATTKWVRFYVVGCNSDNSVAGTTWADSLQWVPAEVGGTLSLKRGSTTSTLTSNAGVLTVAAPSVVVNAATSLTETAATTAAVTAGTSLTLQGATTAINGTTSLTTTSPTTTVNAATALVVASPTLTMNSGGAMLGSPTGGLQGANTINAAGLFRNGAAPLFNGANALSAALSFSAFGVLLGSPAGGDKGAGTINAQAGLYDNNNRVLANGANTLSQSVQLSGFGVQLGSPAGADKGAGTINAQNGLYDNNSRVLHEGTNTVAAVVLSGASASLQAESTITAFINRRVVSNVEGGSSSSSIAHGTVTSGGALSTGQGFSSARTGVGQYTLTWTQAFFQVPAVVITPNTSGGTTASAVAPTTSGATIQTYDMAGVLSDTAFSFVAIGTK